MDLEQIKARWEEVGRNFPVNGQVTPTSRDPYLGELEREYVLGHLKPHFTCLEVGCGDGGHTVYYAKRVQNIHAIDVAGSLIDVARRRLAEQSVRNVDLHVGSVLDVDAIFAGQRFDCVISQRCLINLPTWEHQRRAITHIHSLLSDEGVLLLTEGFQENLDSLNGVRTQFGLAEIKVVDYNRNLGRADFEGFIGESFDILERRHYGAYLFLSRVYHPLLVLPEAPRHESKLNRVAMDISKGLAMPDMEKYSYNLFYVLRKRRT